MTAISVSERLLEMAAFYTPLALTVTYQMCPCGRGRFFCVIFHTYKLTQPSLGCSPGDGCVVISLKWIYLLLRPPCLPEMFRFRSAIFRSEEERNCLSLSSKARSPEGVVSAA